ncbi:MAG: hypothetical protein I8H74_02405 [Moraxellaceae bacterium]|nr:hypothetical protein [Moraxellaceae bacterium]
MQKYRIAHIRQQGVDLIIAPLDSSFGNKGLSSQNLFMQTLEAYAHRAGLAGTVVPVWLSGRQMNFIAPRPWHPFFKSLSWNDVLRNINKELTINE